MGFNAPQWDDLKPETKETYFYELIRRDAIEIDTMKKKIKDLETDNKTMRDALVEVFGCQDANLCDGCLLTIKCAIERKTLGDLIKESKDDEKAGDGTETVRP